MEQQESNLKEELNSIDKQLADPNIFSSKNYPQISIGAQNAHQSECGAYTGEISAKMIRSTGAEYVILGHSERRLYFNETDELVAKKIDTALLNNLKIICCIGETKKEREAVQQFDREVVLGKLLKWIGTK